MYAHLLADNNKTVGTRETIKAIEKDQAEMVFVAKDAEKHVILPVMNACRVKSISVIEVESMAELGKACSVQVKTAVAACLKG